MFALKRTHWKSIFREVAIKKWEKFIISHFFSESDTDLVLWYDFHVANGNYGFALEVG